MKGWCLDSLIGLLSLRTRMSLTLRYAIVLLGADMGIKHRGYKKNVSNVTSPLWMPWLSCHLTDLSDFYLSDMRRPRVVGMERSPAHVGVVPEDD